MEKQREATTTDGAAVRILRTVGLRPSRTGTTTGVVIGDRSPGWLDSARTRLRRVIRCWDGEAAQRRAATWPPTVCAWMDAKAKFPTQFTHRSTTVGVEDNDGSGE